MYEGVEIPLLEKLSKRISAKHRTVLYEVLGEVERNMRLNFTRIYPAAGTQQYDKFFDAERPNNRLIYSYLFEKTEFLSIIEQSTFNDLVPTSLMPLQSIITENEKVNVFQRTKENAVQQQKA